MKHFDRSLPMMLHRTLDVVMPPFREIFSQYGLTEQQWRVLRVLWEEDEKPLLALSSDTLIPSPSLVGVVDRLIRRGLVQRKRSSRDRRVVYVSCTDSGRALEEEVSPKVDAIYGELEASVDPVLWKKLFFAMDQIVAAQGKAVAGREKPPAEGANK